MAIADSAGMAAGDTDDRLPPLRDDLKLLPAAQDRSGQPAWTIFDPVRNRYFRIGPEAFECLIRWSVGSVGRLVETVRTQSVYAPDEGVVSKLIAFLQSNALLVRADSEVAASFGRIAEAGQQAWYKRAVHNYLFFRIPLVRPTQFLRATQPIADFVACSAVRYTILALGVLGLFLVSRQWDAFVTTFLGYLSWQGAVAIALTLTLTKILHELGHAYATTRYGGRVPTMGLAFLVLYPVLYTDTSDAWRMTSRRARLAIGTAGIRVELAIALLATFLWSFLPDGPVRSAVFLLASATWISTLLINLSPFLRFDGYYILSDWLDIPNLQPRAFALTRWWLREVLFGFGLPMPEPFARSTRRLLIAYSIGTWIYRFFLFLGIALLVYHLFFKVIGIVLFVIEIVYFILLPIIKEIRAWGQLRPHARPTVNIAVSLSVLGFLIWLFVTPWQTEVAAPALVESRVSSEVLNAIPARVRSIEIREGQAVTAGQPLVLLESPMLLSALSANAARQKAVTLQLGRARTTDEGRGDVARLEEELRGLQSSRSRIEARMSRLTVSAPGDGVFRDLPAGLMPGQWIAGGTLLGRVVSSDARMLAYADQADLPRLREGAEVRFIPEDPSRASIGGTVRRIDGLGAERLSSAHFSASFGGGVAARQQAQDREWVPLNAVYRIEIALNEALTLDRPLRGTAQIEAPPQSLVTRVWRSVGAVLVRESGF